MDVQHDGKPYQEQDGAPGENSVYIPPGNPSEEKYRLGTFDKFPEDVPVGPISLAQAGFFFTGYKDRVKCYSCSSMVESWEVGADPSSPKWHRENCLHQNAPRNSILNIPATSMENFFSSHTVDLSGYHAYIPPGNCFSEKYRLATFSKFPARSVEAPILAMNGFMYTGEGSMVKCYSCGKSAQNLSPYDSGSSRYHEAHCEHINGLDTRNEPLSSMPSFRIEPQKHFQCHSDTMAMETQDLEENMDAHATQQQVPDSEWTYKIVHMKPWIMDSKLSHWTINGTNTSNHLGWSLGGGEGMPERAGPSKATLLQQYKCEHPKFPHMKDYACRLRSFVSRWPMEAGKPTPEQIAEAGFFCIGNPDRVRCWYCNGGLRNYEAEPWTEHAKWFPGCEFVLQQKGPEFVIQQMGRVTRPAIKNGVPLASMIQEDLSHPPSTSELRFNSSANSGGDVEPSKRSKSMQEEINKLATKARELGFLDVVVTFEMVKKDSFTFAELMDILLDESEKKNTPITKENTEKVQEKPGVNMKVKENQKAASTPAAPATSDEMKNKLAEMELERMCKLCQRNPADNVVWRCGHISFCPSCAATKPAKCAVCKGEVLDLIQIQK